MSCLGWVRGLGRVVVPVGAVVAVVASGAVLAPVAPSPAAPEPLAHTKSTAKSVPMPARCGADGARCLRGLTLSDGWSVSAYSNVALTGSSAVTHAVVVIEGGGRDGAFTFSGMMAAAAKSGVTDSTMVIAPWFKTDQDKPGAREARWTSGGWKIGDPATQPSDLSSFSVVDSIITTLADKTKFPQLTWVTITGHSSGGQFTDRYASLSSVPNALSGVLVSYVIANPSSFLNYDSTRPVGAGETFANPSSSTCPGFDTYKYGMSGRSGYVAQLTPQQAETNFLSRRVTILSGGADNFQNGDMDASCSGNLEGPNRVTRAANFFAHMRAIDPSAPHDRIVVPGVDHDHLDLYESPLASMVLFGVSTQTGGAQ